MASAVPTTLHHYYESSGLPFQSLSDLNDDEFLAHVERLGRAPVKVNRFATENLRTSYLVFRRHTERVIRERFIRKGGRPELEAPRYLTLGPVCWFLDWYQDAKEIVVAIKDIGSEHVSFTYPDSMTSLLLAEGRMEPYRRYSQPHHGQVFRLEEFAGLIGTLGVPDETDAENQKFGNLIVEAQLWSLEPIGPWLRRGRG